MVRYIKGLHEIIDQYDGFIIDLWGVTHNGASLFPDVLSCLVSLQEQGKTVVFLSNAPRRAHAAVARLEELGVPQDLYHSLITSGEKTHHSLKHRPDEFYKSLGRNAFHIGATKDHSLFDEDVCLKVDSLDEADFLLNSGIAVAGETVETYEKTLQQASQMGLPMVCANPDLVVQIRGALELCAGGIAKRYEELGGDVSYHGKPYSSVYEWVKEVFSSDARLLAIGDAFETDIKGAHNVKIDSAFIGNGIHQEDLRVQYGELPKDEDIQKLCDVYGIQPTFVMPGLIY